MTKSDQPIPEQVEAQALNWLTRQLSGEMDDSERFELLDWLDASPIHESAFNQLRSDMVMIDEAIFTQASTVTSNTQDSTNVSKLEPKRATQHKPEPIFRKFVLLATAAVLALVMVNFSLTPQFQDRLGADYVVSKGEQSEQVLDDGSTIRLNTATALSLAYSETKRGITLKTGEAFFKVAKDTARPFTVSIKGWDVTALGTEFIVKEITDGIAVSVLESAVSVTRSGQAADTGQVVKAGEQLVVTSQSSQSRIPPPNASSWLQGDLIFNQTPFSQVIEEVNRYRPGRIVLTNPDLAERKLTLVIRLNEIDELLPVLANELQIKYTKLSDSIVFLY